MIRLIGFLLWVCGPMCVHAISGRIELAGVDADQLTSYQLFGSGLLRPENSGLQLQQAFVNTQFDLAGHWSVDASFNVHQDGEKHLGLTQAFLQYKPLTPNKIKFKSRLGFF